MSEMKHGVERCIYVDALHAPSWFIRILLQISNQPLAYGATKYLWTAFDGGMTKEDTISTKIRVILFRV